MLYSIGLLILVAVISFTLGFEYGKRRVTLNNVVAVDPAGERRNDFDRLLKLANHPGPKPGIEKMGVLEIDSESGLIVDLVEEKQV